jgi:CBS domain-containing membrane protein
MMRIADLMTPEPLTVRLHELAPRALELMHLARIRHLPVIDDRGAVVGVVDHGALECALERRPPPRVGELMSPVPSVAPETAVRDAARLLLRDKLGCLPVLRHGVLVGIVTEADFVKRTVRELDDDAPDTEPQAAGFAR